MKKLSLLLAAFMALTIISCDNEEDIVKDIQDDDKVELNNDVETVVTSEELSESLMETMDYEIDLYSFIESEYEQTSTKQGGDNYYYYYKEMWKKWKRYKDEQMPDISIEFGEEGRYPMKITINYGDGIELNSGKVVSGAIIIELTAAPFTDGAVREVSYDLMIDDVWMDGTKRIEFTGEKGVSHKFEYKSDMTFGFPDETEIHRVAERTREWISGLDTKLDTSDDKIQITGFVTCVDTEENEYTKAIDEENPLIRIGTCKVIVQGVVKFTQNEVEFATLDYGDGECDNIATYTYTNDEGETVTKEIEIGKHRRHKKDK
jgi:hypothetical protein